MSAVYRIRQFVHALAASWWPGALDEQAAAEVLAPAPLALFRRMRPEERQHSLRVLAHLRAAGQRDPDLLAAALLHDVGKTRVRLHVWERPLPVLARAWLPALAQRWSAGEPRGWRRPFVVAARHPEWGAELAAAAGCSPVTLALIRAHQTPARAGEADRLLAALQSADDAS